MSNQIKLISALFIFFYLGIITNIFCQLPGNRNIALNEGIGNTTTTNTNYGAGMGNIAGIADIGDIIVGTSYRFVPELEGFNTASLALVVPVNIGSFGLGISRFGDELFNQQMVSVGYANTFGIASLGVKAGYLQYSIDGYGSKGVILIDFGGIAKLTEELLIGAHITNFNQSKLAELEDERVPTILALGMSYRPSTQVMVNLEVEKDIDFNPVFKFGVEYKIIEQVSLRTGINTKPNRQFYGFGLRPNNIPVMLDYTFSNNKLPGTAHQLGIGYKIKSRK
jgi:hypothetical protein